jgi:beta-phosphoglucomutase-like phosphatase (HAD superfamily)
VTDPTVAVLDIDGTLIDSNNQHALAWYRALRSVGETYPVWRLHRLMGMGGDQVVMAVGGEDPERRVGDQAREQQGKEVDALLEEMAPLPGARNLLVAVVRSGGFGDDELREAGAIAIYDTPGDLGKALGDTPLASRHRHRRALGRIRPCG